MAADHLEAMGELAPAPALLPEDLVPARPAAASVSAPPRAAPVAFPGKPYVPRDQKMKHLMRKDFGRRKC